MENLKIGDYVEYLNLTWMVYSRTQIKTRKDGSTFETVRLCPPPFKFHDVKYPRSKMCGVKVSNLKKVEK